jgi:rubrerythrin
MQNHPSFLPLLEGARCGNTVPFMFIKVYCSDSEKKQIEKSASDAGFTSVSKYLREKAFAEEHHRATLVELISHMVKLVEAELLPPEMSDKLFAIAQDVLDGKPISKSREKIAEVCSFETKGDKR